MRAANSGSGQGHHAGGHYSVVGHPPRTTSHPSSARRTEIRGWISRSQGALIPISAGCHAARWQFLRRPSDCLNVFGEICQGRHLKELTQGDIHAEGTPNPGEKLRPARNECPPKSKKLSCRPTRSNFSTSAQSRARRGLVYARLWAEVLKLERVRAARQLVELGRTLVAGGTLFSPGFGVPSAWMSPCVSSLRCRPWQNSPSTLPTIRWTAEELPSRGAWHPALIGMRAPCRRKIHPRISVLLAELGV